MSHVPDLQPRLKVWMRVPMPAAACQSSPARGRSCGGDFSFGKMSGHVVLPHRKPGPPPHCWLYPAHPCQLPKGSTGMCSTGWELLVEEVAPPLPPLVHLGPQLWLGHGHPWVQPAAGSHCRAFHDPSRLFIRPHVQPPCLSQAQTRAMGIPTLPFIIYFIILLYAHTGWGKGGLGS